MLAVLERDQPGLAAIHLRGAGPLGPDVLDHLPGLGYAVLSGDVPGARWACRLRHPTLGEADVWADDDVASRTDQVLGDATTLTPGERAAAAASTGVLLLRVAPRWRDVRRDRKTLLRIAAAVLGDRGVMVLDLGSRLPWSPAALAEELQHEAALDLEALYSIHAVPSAGGRLWLHTHGLEDLGAADVELVDADPAFAAAASDPIRALAAMLLERAGAAGRRASDPRQGSPLGTELRFGDPGGRARLVPLTTFLRTAGSAVRASRRAAGPGHAGRRVVLCEPERRGPLGLPGRRTDVPEPLALARRPPPDRFVVYIPPAATALMAERARGTVRVLQARMAEFAALRPTPLVKLGYPTRDGGQEHLWFEAHGFTDTTVVASLQNEPIDVDLRLGVRAERPLDLLTDWALVTPAGWITPRSSLATRRLREQASAEGSRPDRVSNAAT